APRRQPGRSRTSGAVYPFFRRAHRGAAAVLARDRLAGYRALVNRAIRFGLVVLAIAVGDGAFVLHARAPFPSEKTPEGAYARIAVAITEGRPRDCFAYLETQAQWASYSIRDFRSKASTLVSRSYPEPERATLLARYRHESEAPDGADVWAYLAE